MLKGFMKGEGDMKRNVSEQGLKTIRGVFVCQFCCSLERVEKDRNQM
jgi:hypothetical protein